MHHALCREFRFLVAMPLEVPLPRLNFEELFVALLRKVSFCDLLYFEDLNGVFSGRHDRAVGARDFACAASSRVRFNVSVNFNPLGWFP